MSKVKPVRKAPLWMKCSRGCSGSRERLYLFLGAPETDWLWKSSGYVGILRGRARNIKYRCAQNVRKTFSCEKDYAEGFASPEEISRGILGQVQNPALFLKLCKQ